MLHHVLEHQRIVWSSTLIGTQLEHRNTDHMFLDVLVRLYNWKPGSFVKKCVYFLHLLHRIIFLSVTFLCTSLIFCVSISTVIVLGSISIPFIFFFLDYFTVSAFSFPIIRRISLSRVIPWSLNYWFHTGFF